MVPVDLRKALTAAPKVEKLWDALTPIARRDFISWIQSAKQVETRTRRIEKAVSMLKAGKKRPCCYALVPMNLYKALDGHKKAKIQWKLLTPDQRRDFIDWIDKATDEDVHRDRVAKTCVLLASGKVHP